MLEIKKKPDVLTNTLSAKDFQSFYWSVKELNEFCQQHQLSVAGDKADKCFRIARFLATGERLAPKVSRRAGLKDSQRGKLSRDTEVINYVNDAETRAFFQSELGQNFKFTVIFHNYRRELLASGKTVTYGDLVDALEHIQKQGHAPTEGLSDACEYNRFTSEFAKHEKCREPDDAKNAWHKLIQYSGPHTYQHYKQHIEGIS